MNKKKSPAAVGAFVLGAGSLAIALLVVFGKGSFFDQKYKAVLYFDESINGLDVGAPIDFMGVKIGSVMHVDLVVDVGNGSFLRPVTISMDARRIAFKKAGDVAYDIEEWMEMLIREKGLRAQLATQSMLTGKLKVHLLLHPQSQIRRQDFHNSLFEIPTIPSTQASIVKSIEQIPIHDIMLDLRDAAHGIKELVNDQETRAMITNLNSALVRLDATLGEADGFLKNSGVLLDDVAGDARALLRQTSASMEKLDGIMTNATLLMATLKSNAPALLASLTQLSNELNAVLDDQSPFHTSVLDTLDELQKALRAFSELTDYLNRYPEALIQGKK